VYPVAKAMMTTRYLNRGYEEVPGLDKLPVKRIRGIDEDASRPLPAAWSDELEGLGCEAGK
jgi:hypothetical protein